MKVIKNAKTKPARYYGLHMLPGVAEYNDGGDAKPYRIFINESTIKNMDPSFTGLPVYVQHKDEVTFDNIQVEADGYVVKSFYNAADGKHWAEFIIVSDKGHEALRNGWRLSNAYIPKEFGQGGLWNGVEYQKEVTSGEYEHLALVPNPRYDESIILTPEEFKQYNADKSVEIQRLANSKEEKSVLKLFKKQKVENSADFDTTMVELPKSKKEMTLKDAVEAADTLMNMQGYASGDHMVKVGDEEMSVNDMVEGYESMKNKMAEDEEAKKNADDEEEKKKENMDDEEKKENTDEEEEKKENEKKLDLDGENENKVPASYDPEKTQNSKEFSKTLKNAETAIVDPILVDLNKMERGKERYGSSR